MDDERIERVLRGYRLPDVSQVLDHRVLSDGAALLARARNRRAEPRATAGDVGRHVLDGLGFGYLTWAYDLITKNDAEYRVEFI